jgi:hypothetical protein
MPIDNRMLLVLCDVGVGGAIVELVEHVAHRSEENSGAVFERFRRRRVERGVDVACDGCGSHERPLLRWTPGA